MEAEIGRGAGGRWAGKLGRFGWDILGKCFILELFSCFEIDKCVFCDIIVKEPADGQSET